MAKKTKAKEAAAAKPPTCELVQILPDRCAVCHDTATKQERTVISERDISGLARDGREYHRIAWVQVVCATCSRRRVNREFSAIVGGKPAEPPAPIAAPAEPPAEARGSVHVVHLPSPAGPRQPHGTDWRR